MTDVRRTGAGVPRTGGGPIRTVALLLATVTTGLTAGTFADWSIAVMPGLRGLDDRAFVLAFHGLDQAIVANPLFIGVQFTGALLFTALAAVLHLRRDRWPVLGWVAAALAFYLAAVVVTMGVNEPLNQTLHSAGDLAGAADFARARARFDEATWNTWNTVRAVASTIAFGCLGWALVLHRR